MVLRFRKFFLKHFKAPQTLFAFPVDGGPNPSNRGLALMVAVVIIATIMLFATDLIVSSNVDLRLAVAERENVQAEYLAKSGLNLGIFLNLADYGVDLFLASPQSPMKQAMSDGPGDMWTMLNGIPIGGEVAEQFQKKFSLNQVMDDGVLNQLKTFEGTFTINIEDEQNKININYCVHGRECPEVMSMLESLMSCPVEKSYLERREFKTRETIYKIKDFVDKNSVAEPFSGVSDEEDPYRKKVPPFKVKNAPFDSVDEMQLVDGWNSDIHKVFSRYITVFPFQDPNKVGQTYKLNFNTMRSELLQCLFPESLKDCRDKSVLALNERDEKKTTLANSAQAIQDKIKQTFCYNPGPGIQANSPQDKSTWFDVKSRVFRIAATGKSGDQERTIETVIERKFPDPTKKNSSSYRTLYWRLR